MLGNDVNGFLCIFTALLKQLETDFIDIYQKF